MIVVIIVIFLQWMLKWNLWAEQTMQCCIIFSVVLQSYKKYVRAVVSFFYNISMKIIIFNTIYNISWIILSLRRLESNFDQILPPINHFVSITFKNFLRYWRSLRICLYFILIDDRWEQKISWQIITEL